MFEKNVPLKQISHYKIGGNAKYFFEAKKIDSLIEAIEKQRQLKTPLFILAGATNVLIDDRGFNGLIIKPDFQFIKKSPHTKRSYGVGVINVGAGVLMKDLINFTIEENFSGLEWAGGLPGTLGGAIRGNAGAFGGETKNIIEEVVSLDISQKIPKIIKRKAKDCDFEYRSSIFKKNPQREIIIEATLKLQKGDKKEIEEKISQNINYRFLKHPMEYPSLGSTFKNIPISQINNNININQLLNQHKSALIIKNDPFPVIPVAFLISEAGLKGISIGGAMISPKHPNFIVNVLDAKAEDVKNLIQLVKKEVNKKFKIELQEEIEQI
ncbi:MAG: UDP-N-acetylmuramate dehydrogenase [Patescibacteria group bacterium]